MLLQSIENKVRVVTYMCVAMVIGVVLICGICFYTCYQMVQESHKDIYVMVGNMPMLAERTKMETTLEIECKSHVQLFHQYFFNIAPDDEYIKWTNQKASYLADQSAQKQEKAMRERGFYSEILSASAVCSIMCDSIQLDMENMKFRYFGTQIIERKSNKKLRQLITEGYLKTVPRTQNNPHGLLITDWKTIENRDIGN